MAPIAQLAQGTTLSSALFTVRNAGFAPDVGRFDNIDSFGVDEGNSLYLIDIDGEVFVIEPAPAPAAASMPKWLQFR